jgi:hypothetical protein
MNKSFLLYLLLSGCTAVSGCANMKNPALDHRITCSLDGKAAYVVTYGPIAFTEEVPDADALCGSITKTQALTVAAPAISASAPK